MDVNNLLKFIRIILLNHIQENIDAEILFPRLIFLRRGKFS